MCGIAGYYGERKLTADTLSHCKELMHRRGPDFSDHVEIKTEPRYLNLLHSRLSIIDLDPRSNQPFKIGNFVLIFNGEIYNYLELRENLIRKGIQLETQSDTEVLLHYFIEYKEECLKFFEGMWSFAIFDGNTNEIFLARDRFGEKPLYYCALGQDFCFASEVKFLESLLKKKFRVNEKHVVRYLVNGFRSLYKTGDTFFEGVKELAAAHYMKVNSSGDITINRYWQISAKVEQSMSLIEAIEGYKERLLNSLKIRLRSDVPLAFCLSGGVDSAALTSCAAKLFGYAVNTFSIIDKDARYDESQMIKATIEDLACNHTLIETSRENFYSRLKQLISYHDAPLATISYYVHSLLTEKIAEKGFKVVISGTGADETVTGYYDHFLLYLAEISSLSCYDAQLSAWEKHVKPLVRNPFLNNEKLYQLNPSFRSHIYLDQDIYESYLIKPFHEDFVESNYSTSLLRNRMLNELFHEIVPVILHEDDLNSMYYSIENRSPYLDTNLIEFAFTIPSEYLINDGYGKFILREASKDFLNEKVRTQRKKVGFNASLHSLINFQDKEVRKELMSDSPIFEIVNREKIQSLLDIEPFSDQLNKFMFNFICAKLFLEERSERSYTT